MTIYTPSTNEKKADKDDVETPEVVTEPLTSFKDEEGDEAEVFPKLVRVTYFQRSRRTFCIHLLLTIMVLVILACGAIGAVVFYRHLNRNHVYSGTCGNVYYDASFSEQTEGMWSQNQQGEQKMAYLEEQISVSQDDLYESIYTPGFDEVRENYVWHDFQMNYTVIIDHGLETCYVMKLNRTLIAPPKDVIDLIHKVVTGYYLPKAKVIRENYLMVFPALTDLTGFGKDISTRCSEYTSFWLMKYSDILRNKRDTAAAGGEINVYAMLSNHIDNQVIVKMFVHNLDIEEL